jgi:autophagy-related protein 16
LQRNPVRAAYIVSLESQISSLRDELASVYKTQNQNTQRLLSMTETLREKEEFSRIEAENMRRLQEDASILARKVEQHNELMSEKDRTAQILHDEINTLQLELGQIEERNAILVKDNAKLLQRWLDAKQEEVNKMNEVNEFYQDMRTKQDRVVTESASPTGGGTGTSDQANGKPARLSGNDQLNGTASTVKTTDGTTSSGENSLSLTPNG